MIRLRPRLLKITACALIALPARTLPAIEPPLSPPEVFEKVRPSVLTLHITTRSGEAFTGTAFMVSTNGVAATAWHLVHDAVSVRGTFADRGECRMLRIVRRDEVHDLALIALDRMDLPALALAREIPRIGSRVYTIGAPRGYEFSFVDGMMNQVQEINSFPQYQVSCPISPGNSGGPLLNERGEVTGMISWRKRNAQNVSFAVPGTFLSNLLSVSISESDARRPSPDAGVSETGGEPVANAASLAGPKPVGPSSEATLDAGQGFPAAPTCRSTITDAPDTGQSFEEFRRFLDAASSLPVAVRVSVGGIEEEFHFVVPDAPFGNRTGNEASGWTQGSNLTQD